MHVTIAQHKADIASICRRYRVRRLDVFGSAARASDFNLSSSDADFLVEFEPGSEPGLHAYFGTKSALERLLGRPVDLVEAGAIRNPYLLEDISRHSESIYAS
jgi:predicted nucleotidyltransferase